MPLAQRIINVEFRLGQGAFNARGADTVRLTGLRAQVNITKAGGISMAQLEMRIWGVPLSVMNKLTVLNTVAYAQQRNNTVIVEAGDEKNGVGVCFQGSIRECWADGAEAPQVTLHVAAFAGFYELMGPTPPISYRGSVDLATVLNSIATQLGYSLENNGVVGRLQNPYFPGSLGSQLAAVARAANIHYFMDANLRVLAVWPKNRGRNQPPVLLNRDSGLIAYPTFTQNGIILRSIYNPSLAFGYPVRVESDFLAATGDWTIASVSHNLDSNMPGGQWATEIGCTLLGAPIGIIGNQ